MRARYDAFESELQERSKSLQATHDRRCKCSQSDVSFQKTPFQSRQENGGDVGGVVKSKSRDSSPTSARICCSEGGSASAHSQATRPLPSIADVRQRTDGNSELYAFYLKVFPLLKGTSVEIFRRSLQRFELRQLVLSSDLQRLELWPPLLMTVPSPLQGSRCSARTHSSPPSTTTTTTGANPTRGRRRVAEAFLRVDGLTRIHIPRATLTAVQQTMIGTADIAEVPQLLGPPLEESQEPFLASGPSYFPFDLMLGSAEPWRLVATDIQTFHVVTAAVGALLAARTSLPSFALALGLGATSMVG